MRLACSKTAWKSSTTESSTWASSMTRPAVVLSAGEILQSGAGKVCAGGCVPRGRAESVCVL